MPEHENLPSERQAWKASKPSTVSKHEQSTDVNAARKDAVSELRIPSDKTIENGADGKPKIVSTGASASEVPQVTPASNAAAKVTGLPNQSTSSTTAIPQSSRGLDLPPHLFRGGMTKKSGRITIASMRSGRGNPRLGIVSKHLVIRPKSPLTIRPPPSQADSSLEPGKPAPDLSESKNEEARRKAGPSGNVTFCPSIPLPLSEFLPGPAAYRPTSDTKNEILKFDAPPFVPAQKIRDVMALNALEADKTGKGQKNVQSDNQVGIRKADISPGHPEKTLNAAASPFKSSTTSDLNNNQTFLMLNLSDKTTSTVVAGGPKASPRALSPSATPFELSKRTEKVDGSSMQIKTAPSGISLMSTFDPNTPSFIPAQSYAVASQLRIYTPASVSIQAMSTMSTASSSDKSFTPLPAYFPERFVNLLRDAGLHSAEDARTTLDDVDSIYSFVLDLARARPDVLDCFATEFSLVSKLGKLLKFHPFCRSMPARLPRTTTTPVAPFCNSKSLNVLHKVGITSVEELQELLTDSDMVPVFVEQIAKRWPEGLSTFLEVFDLTNRLRKILAYAVHVDIV